MDLIRELKDKLRIEDLMRAGGLELKPVGRSMTARCPFHDEKTPGAFHVYPDRQSFHCFSCAANGDALNWLAWQQHKSLKVGGEQFVEVLKRACELAGIQYPEDEAAVKRTAARRKREEALSLYLKASRAALTAEQRSQIADRKPWLTSEVRERWEIGGCPSLKQCEAAGLTPKMLLDLGLAREGKDGDVRLTWHHRFVIPFRERGRVVFLAARRLTDGCLRCGHPEGGTDGQACPNCGGAAFPKMLYMRTGEKVQMPAAFNLDALYGQDAREKGVLCVEGPLDAIACVERGWPAVGMLRSAPSAALCRCFGQTGEPGLQSRAGVPGLQSRTGVSGLRPILLLDGTPDVDQEKRCREAAKLGPACRIALCPAGKDPDDLDAEELGKVVAEARPVIDEWMDWIEGTKE